MITELYNLLDSIPAFAVWLFLSCTGLLLAVFESLFSDGRGGGGYYD